MIPQKGQYVKLMFRNGAQAEGFVDSWSDAQSVLKSDNGSLFLVQSTAEDVMAIKIVADFVPRVTLEQNLEEYQEKFQEELEKPSADDLRIKNLAQLKIAMLQNEKQITAAKLRSHDISSSNRKASYEHGLFTKQSSK